MIYDSNARSIGEMIKAKMKEQAEQRRVVTLPPRKFDPPKKASRNQRAHGTRSASRGKAPSAITAALIKWRIDSPVSLWNRLQSRLLFGSSSRYTAKRNQLPADGSHQLGAPDH
jgi:hypothetical protein